MKSAIIDTVRKLLRMARTTKGAEADVARLRARELMDKHRLEISLDEVEDFRMEVSGVAGTFWREQLLTGIGKMYSVRILRVEKQPKLAVLAGYESDVKRTWEMYRHLQFRLMVQCWCDWEAFNKRVSYRESLSWVDRMMIDSLLRAPSERRYETPKVFPVWSRVYLNTTSGEICKVIHRITPEKPTVSRAFNPYVSPPEEDEEKLKERKEIERILLDRDQLAVDFSFDAARDLQTTALRTAVARAQQAWVGVNRDMQKLLTASSSWLPPPPPPPEPPPPPPPKIRGRFTELDFEE